ncbi:DMT family transporter [Alloscardovia venturai]|uniref:DMT family transporter n=1 Tax=Alloscardovia venturai TaxID=1769421 RepID=A0ABW2Y3G4_9BIFI
MNHIANTSPVFFLLGVQTVAIALANELSKIAFVQIDPILVAWWRMGFTALIMMMWRRPFSSDKRKNLPHDRKTWIVLAVLGVATAGMNSVFYIAINSLNSGVATAIEFIGPLVVAVWTGRSWREYLGAGLAFVGLLVLAGTSIFSLGPSSVPGLVAIITSGALWGLYIVLGRQVAHGGNGLDNLALSMTMGWILQSVLLAKSAVEGVIRPARTATWAKESDGAVKLVALMLVIALLASIVSYVMDQILMRRVTASRFSVMQAVLPAVNLVVSLVFGDRPVLLDYVGVAIIIFAVVVSFSSDEDPLPSHDLTHRHHVGLHEEDGSVEEIDIPD